MKGNFEACLAITLKHEGGWADHPQDPGGATMKGVTLATFRKYRPGATKADLRNISDADLRRIYRDGYWDEVRGDDLPAGLDLVAFDGAVNSGPSRGAKWVQSAVGAQADGRIGPATLLSVGKADTSTAIRRACQERMRFLQGLKTWPTFGKGWQRRVNEVEAAALAMMGSAPVADSLAPQGLFASLIAALVKLFRR